MEIKTALLLIDIQNDYFEEGKNPLTGSFEASLNAKELLKYFRAKAWPVVYIQHVANREAATFFVPGTDGVEIHDNVKPLVDEKIFVKHYPNSFRETGLNDYLLANGINDLVICGMMTHMCVDATVRAAKDLGYDCTIIKDACATKNLQIKSRTVKAEEVQTAFLAALSYYYSVVVSTETYLNGLKETEMNES